MCITLKYTYSLIEGSFEAKLPTVWTDEKQRREESEKRGEEKRREEKKQQQQQVHYSYSYNSYNCFNCHNYMSNYTTTTPTTTILTATTTLHLQQHQLHYNYKYTTTTTTSTSTTTITLHFATPHYILQLWARWPLQPLQKSQPPRSLSGFALPSLHHGNSSLL